MIQEQTHGEKVVEKLFKQLDEKRFFYIAEYRIPGSRQSLYPDFILVVRDLGMLIIEVKDYIEILDGSTQKELSIRQRDGKIVQVENPEQQARRYAHELSNVLKERDDLLRKERGQNERKELAFRWQPIVIYPNLSRSLINQMEKYNVTQPNTTWCRDDLVSIESLTKAIERSMTGQKPVPFNVMNEIFNALRGALNPSLVVHDQQGHDIGTLSLLQEYLTFEALKLTGDMSVRLIRGVAGSGKSLILMRRAHHLVEENPNLRILIVTYNSDLADNLRERLGRYEVEVINFHKQCVKAFKEVGFRWKEPIKRIGWLEQYQTSRIQQAGLTIDFVDEEIKWRKEVPIEDNEIYLSCDRKGRGGALIRTKREVINTIYTEYQKYQAYLKNKGDAWWDWEDVASMAVEFASSDGSKLKHYYDVVMVDEAQDFAPVWIQALKQMLKPSGTLFLCDDPTQSLFREFSWKEKGVDVVGRSRILQVPFRNTRQIAQAAHALILADPLISTTDIPAVKLQTIELRDGQMPMLQRFTSQEQEIREVRKKALQWYEESHTKKVAILCHHKKDVKHWADLRESGIYVDSFGKMKGLEFDAVIVPFVCSAFTKRDGNEKDEEFVAKKRREVFTAMTRPRLKLFLSYHDSFPAELEPLEEHVYHER